MYCTDKRGETSNRTAPYGVGFIKKFNRPSWSVEFLDEWYDTTTAGTYDRNDMGADQPPLSTVGNGTAFSLPVLSDNPKIDPVQYGTQSQNA